VWWRTRAPWDLRDTHPAKEAAMAQDRPDLTPVDLEEVRRSLARSGSPWVTGETSMTILVEQERRERLGVPLPPADEVDRLVSASGALAATVRSAGDAGAPTAFDARSWGGGNYVTPVKDQGPCGSCVAFGTVATMETTAAFTRGQPSFDPDLSEAHLFYVHGAADGATCASGWLPSKAYPFCRNIGITFEDYFPYTSHNSGGATLHADWPNRLARMTSYRTLTGDPAAIKEHLATHGAVSACFVVYQDFFSYRSGVYRHLTGSAAGGHCVCIVGYDDAQGCWIAKNSWNTTWGDGGYVRIGYGECGIETWEVHGVDAVALRMWTGATKVLGCYHASSPRSGWAYVQDRGWLKVTAGNDAAHELMLTDLVAAKVANRPVNLFENNGTIDISQVY
jgi:C1A family cysteine protease